MTEKTEAEAAAQAELSALAVDLDAMRGLLSRLVDTLGEMDWSPEAQEGTAPPPLSSPLHRAAVELLDECIEPALRVARAAASLTPERHEQQWRAEAAKLAAGAAEDLARELVASLTKAAAGAAEAAKALLKARILTEGDTARAIAADQERLQAAAAGLASMVEEIRSRREP